jgi:hypothetical protein
MRIFLKVNLDNHEDLPQGQSCPLQGLGSFILILHMYICCVEPMSACYHAPLTTLHNLNKAAHCITFSAMTDITCVMVWHLWIVHSSPRWFNPHYFMPVLKIWILYIIPTEHYKCLCPCLSNYVIFKTSVTGPYAVWYSYFFLKFHKFNIP